jgi:hypothetical protein
MKLHALLNSGNVAASLATHKAIQIRSSNTKYLSSASKWPGMFYCTALTRVVYLTTTAVAPRGRWIWPRKILMQKPILLSQPQF